MQHYHVQIRMLVTAESADQARDQITTMLTDCAVREPWLVDTQQSKPRSYTKEKWDSQVG
jgi:hypothetical protein